ncbi:hypothetical protein PoB_004027400 [Plakobranchus ocellatus]|uniref:Uncharacterized protein n=1 Tax=Plakobranchus ocellatus TaxID=259542 RepID=A0AAV4B5X4_9GAST|nr:hypothetical protein PoB_004027400 [Plakobranchus ocellatus]
MRLIIDDDATPVAHHTPIPVPIHWQEQVKVGLDHDVRLGVIEPVPIGTRLTASIRTFGLVLLNRYQLEPLSHGVIEWSSAQRNPVNPGAPLTFRL